MLTSILETTTTTSLDMTTMAICTLVSLALGLAIAACYMYCSEKYSKSFVVTLAVLPILVQAVIMMVNGNLGTGVAIMGAFSLIRFRSAAGSAREIGAVFFAMTVGLATGMGYIGFAALITVIVALLYVVLSKSNFGGNNAGCKNLKVTIPENLNYSGMFDDLFEKFLSEVSIEKVKTTNLGSMFEVSYRIRFKDERSEKELIDEIRVRNGNLPVLCARVSSSTEEL